MSQSLEKIVETNQQFAKEHGLKLTVEPHLDLIQVWKIDPNEVLGGKKLFIITRRQIDDQPGQGGDFRHLLTEHLEQR
jgi:hypothetical protein